MFSNFNCFNLATDVRGKKMYGLGINDKLTDCSTYGGPEQQPSQYHGPPPYEARIRAVLRQLSIDKRKEEHASLDKTELLEEKLALDAMDKLFEIGEKGLKNKKIVLDPLENDLSCVLPYLESFSNQLGTDNLKFDYHEREEGNHIHVEINGIKVEIQSKKRFENAQGQTFGEMLKSCMDYWHYIILYE